MPIYEYKCQQCNNKIEVFQTGKDTIRKCGECQGTLKKCMSVFGVVFKGPGFYATEYGKSK